MFTIATLKREREERRERVVGEYFLNSFLSSKNSSVPCCSGGNRRHAIGKVDVGMTYMLYNRGIVTSSATRM